ncbi:MAG: hypothetical protein QXI19_11360 [Candidatus Caldarchaeum sp.]
MPRQFGFTSEERYEMLTGIAQDIAVNVALAEGTPRGSYASYPSLAGGAEIDLNSDSVSKPLGRLRRVMVSAAVPVRVAVKSVVSGVPTTRGVFFAFPGRAYDFVPESSISVGSGDWFRATIKNLEDSVASDVYVTFVWEEFD